MSFKTEVAIVNLVKTRGFAFVPGTEMKTLLEKSGSLADWDTFAFSWNDLKPDTYMADQGRYRKRRHGVFHANPAGDISIVPNQPHYQSLDYNRLNGGIERWFEPLAIKTLESESLKTILTYARNLCDLLSPTSRRWRIETHQFRIEAQALEKGQPTPEGMHRDGVDYAFVILVQRTNIRSGTTEIQDLERHRLESFTLTVPGDTAILDDQRVYHGVTAVEPLDPSMPAHRDVLVVTLRRL